MADEELENTNEEAEAPKSKKKLLIIIVLVLVLAGGGAGFFLLGGEPEVELSPEEIKAQRMEERAIMVEEGVRGERLRLQPLTANLSGRDSFLRVQVQIELWDTSSSPSHEDMKVEMRDELLTLLSEKTPDELLKPGARALLKSEMINSLNKRFPREEPVRDIFFQEFVVQ